METDARAPTFEEMTREQRTFCGVWPSYSKYAFDAIAEQPELDPPNYVAAKMEGHNPSHK